MGARIYSQFKLSNMKDGKIKFIHTVFFWWKKGITQEEEKEFLQAVKKLGTINSIHAFYGGKPAGTSREVIDGSYDYAINVHFKNKKDHDIYQEHPIHDDFREKAPLWSVVKVYDNIVA